MEKEVQATKVRTKNVVKQKIKVTTRQEIIAKSLDMARRDVIYAEMELGFLRELQENCKDSIASEMKVASVYGDNRLSELIDNLEGQHYIALKRLNYYKGLREKVWIKKSIKLATEIRGSLPELEVTEVKIPPVIHVDFIDEE